MKVTVRELLDLNKDVDVYDGIDGQLPIPFYGQIALTAEGEHRFGAVLEYPVELHGRRADILVKGWGWLHHKRVQDFFNAMAGRNLTENYTKWFKEAWWNEHQ